MLRVLKQPPIKSYFSKCLLKGKKKSPRFSVGGGVSSYTQQFWWCGRERCGKEPRGPYDWAVVWAWWGGGGVGFSLLGKFFQFQAIPARF